MTLEQIRAVLIQYRTILEEGGAKAERHSVGGVLPTGTAAKSHLLWMCQHLQGLLVEAPTTEIVEKAHRWLGFLQGVLWATGQRTIDQMREDNRGSA